ncbi:MAG: UDP-N-acetylmuramoyl-L-alanyl-D-glutamate--2,6-diaminopimelate ligase [Patescibacteria group bacterium]|jgi:UDP-N-acetylmuramoyl-L-alanyl-D-glutamate--2,6-diaminopimelate ligase|nr:UDP-N-acetylmuramoyl-L-alanyl-D-glutamate--2,6-diaminopimelate ligase [Patescibacteria group bacterium]
MLALIKKFIPKKCLQLYHYTLAILANVVYRNPSDKLIVIGVTGTSGKSTVVYLISKLLEKAGFRVGSASTILFKVDKWEKINDRKMTMIGRFALQRLLKMMVKANCQYAVVEVTSQGIEQFRHLGINFDVLLFTNLWPEHIEAHGGFENYKRAKLKLFGKLKTETPKLIAGKKIIKTIIANLDSEHSKDFLNHWAEVKFGYTLGNSSSDEAKVVRAEEIELLGQGSNFQINHNPFQTRLLGRHNVENILAALTVGMSQGLSLSAMAKSLETIYGVPGRIEFIDEGQKFKVVVDYAYEPKAVEALYEVVKNVDHRKIIHILGSTGGGRDTSRRPKLGILAGSNADYVIVANEDPYDEDPKKIIDQVAFGARQAGKKLNHDLFKIMDRRSAIAKALSLAGPNDLVLITGKGSEQAIVVKNNKKILWDDRKVVREELVKIIN